MASRANPLRLNSLQLKTLTLLQELARSPETSTRLEDGAALISALPRPHGDHFHVGEAVVMARDATGLENRSVWTALERKGLARADHPFAIILTPAGLAYDTGSMRAILHRSDH